VAEYLGQEDIVGNVLVFEAVATDSAVVAAEVAVISRVGRGSRRRRKRTFELALEDESGIPKFFPRETERWR
jgi:hypothetical protein